MSLPDTTTKPAFIDVAPDWRKPVLVVNKWDTSIFVNRESGEQRTRQMQRPKLLLTYDRTMASPSTFTLQRLKRLEELGKAVAVPVWTEWMTLATNGGSSVTVSATITTLKFKVGSWAYFKQGSNACFRKIVSATGTTITLSATGADFEPVGFTFAVFTAGARVYPCILGMHEKNTFTFRNRRPDSHNLTLSIMEL